MNIGAIGSKLPLCPIRDGHQPSSRGLDTHCKDFLLKVGSPFSFFCDFWPWHIIWHVALSSGGILNNHPYTPYIVGTLLGTNISHFKGAFEDDFPIPQVGHGNSLVGISWVYPYDIQLATTDFERFVGRKHQLAGGALLDRFGLWNLAFLDMVQPRGFFDCCWMFSMKSYGTCIYIYITYSMIKLFADIHIT